MAAPEGGSLQRLLERRTGEAGKSATLQVTDIVPAELDEKSLWPKHGFYLKLSDGSHSAYAALPFAQNDLVLCNHVQLGQFLRVSALDPASPVPVIRGATPLPGRHPLLHRPSPAKPVEEDSGSLSKKSSFSAMGKLQSKKMPVFSSPERPFRDDSGSLSKKCSFSALGKLQSKRMPVFSSPERPYREENDSLSKKCSFSAMGKLQSKKMPVFSSPAKPVEGDSCSLSKKCSFSALGKLQSKKMPVFSSPERPFREERDSLSKKCPSSAMGKLQSKKMTLFSSPARSIKLDPVESNGEEMPTSARPLKLGIEGSIGDRESLVRNCSSAMGKLQSRKKEQNQAATPIKLDLVRRCASPVAKVQRKKMSTSSSRAPTRFSDPVYSEDNTQVIFRSGKLGIIAKEAELQRDHAQRMALQALRDASATDTLVRFLKTFSELSSSARPEAPAEAMEQFLSIHQEIKQSTAHMETIIATTGERNKTTEEEDEEEEEEGREASSSPTILMEISQNIGEVRQGRKRVAKEKVTTLEKTIRLTKQAQKEAENWFMEFLEAGLENKKKSMMMMRESGCWCPQSVLLKVVNWVEMEQGDGSKGNSHPLAGHISRKLKIKVKNP
ncbi:uncharacterized protein LOC144709720 [Wolffia australiana]